MAEAADPFFMWLCSYPETFTHFICSCVQLQQSFKVKKTPNVPAFKG